MYYIIEEEGDSTAIIMSHTGLIRLLGGTMLLFQVVDTEELVQDMGMLKVKENSF